jgi:hypothetical protein
MNKVKPVKFLWLSIVSSLQVYVIIDEEEKGYMSLVLYASRNFDDCDGEMVNFSHAVGVVSSTWKNQVKSMEMGASNT